MCFCEPRIEFDGLKQERFSVSPLISVGCDSGFQKQYVGVRILRGAATRRDCAYVYLQRIDDLRCNIVLNRKNIRYRPIIGLRPDMSTVRAVNQLRCDAQPLTRFAY